MVFNQLNSRKGVTLIEMLIVLGLISVVISVAASMFLFGLKTFAHGNAQYGIQSDVRLASDYIQKQVRYATSVEVIDAPSIYDAGYSYIYFDDATDELIHKAWNLTTNTHDTTFQHSFLFEFPETGFTLNNSNLTFTVKAIDGTQHYLISTQILLPNLFLRSSSVIAATPKVALKYESR